MAGEQRHTGAPRAAAVSEAPPAPPSGNDQGWGRAKGPTPEQKAIRLADKLAAAVRLWESNPTMNNHWRMLEACSAYESTLR